MAQQVMNEAQMRGYVEKEVRKALLKENVTDEGLISGILGMIPYVAGGGNLSLESLIGGILGQFTVAPLLKLLLNAIGIRSNSKVFEFIMNAAGTYGGARLGDLLDGTSLDLNSLLGL